MKNLMWHVWVLTCVKKLSCDLLFLPFLLWAVWVTSCALFLSGHSLLCFDPVIEVWSTRARIFNKDTVFSLFWMIQLPGMFLNLGFPCYLSSRERVRELECCGGVVGTAPGLGLKAKYFHLNSRLMFSQLWSDKVIRGRWIFCSPRCASQLSFVSGLVFGGSAPTALAES